VLKCLLDKIKKHPDSRRKVTTAGKHRVKFNLVTLMLGHAFDESAAAQIFLNIPECL